MTSNQEHEELAEASLGYYKIPDARKRASMNPEELAIEMSKCKRESPQYIVLSHELTLRISQEEAKLTNKAVWTAGIFSIVGAIVGASATAFLSSQATQTVVNCQSLENRSASAMAPPGGTSNGHPSVIPHPSAVINTPARSKSE